MLLASYFAEERCFSAGVLLKMDWPQCLFCLQEKSSASTGPCLIMEEHYQHLNTAWLLLCECCAGHTAHLSELS